MYCPFTFLKCIYKTCMLWDEKSRICKRKADPERAQIYLKKINEDAKSK